MPAGRPCEYKPEYVQKVLDYLETCGREQTRLPKRVDIALMLDCDEDTLNNWANAKNEDGSLKRPEFFGALTRVDMSQKAQLMDDGTYGGREVNPQIVKLLLGNHGYKERSDVTSGDKQLDGLVIIKHDDPPVPVANESN